MVKSRRRRLENRERLDKVLSSESEPSPDEVAELMEDRASAARFKQAVMFAVSVAAGALVEPLIRLL